jgi:tetratricopeptide (TPR) repeat protein
MKLRGDCHYFRGTAQFERQQFREAAADFEQAIRCIPAHAGAWVWLAAAKSKLGQWQETVQYLLRSQAVQPALARQYRLLGRSLATNAVEEFSKHLPAEPGSDSASLDPRFRTDGLYPFERETTPIVVEPATQAARVGRAMAFQFLGENEAAVRDYCHAIRSAPDELELWFRRGQVWQQLGEDKRAVRDLSHVIHRQREHHLARFYRAVSSARRGDSDRAISDLIKAIRLAPQQTRYHLLRGELNALQGRFGKAIRSYQRAESLDPANPAIFRLRGEARWKRGQVREALTDWNRALELKADQGDVYALRGKALLRSGKPSAAKADFEQAIRLSPRNLSAVIGRAEALTASKRYQSALLWLTKSLHRFNSAQGLADLMLARGRVYLAMGIWAKAAADASSALDLRRDNPRVQTAARFLRARALIQMEQNSAAARDLKKLLRIAPDHPSALALAEWLETPQQPRPIAVQTVERPVKISKPKIIQSPVALNGSVESWSAEGIFDSWLVRDIDRQEYGPVSKVTLNRWVEEGRVSTGMRLLRGDWHKWKRAEKVFPELETTR